MELTLLVYLVKFTTNMMKKLYYLQLDIKKYFYSFNRNILRSLLEKKTKIKNFIELIMMFTSVIYDSEKGVPIVIYYLNFWILHI